MTEKLYKCGYTHCPHPDDKEPITEMEKVGKRYYHKKCFYIRDMIQVAATYYFQYIDENAEYKILVGVLNNIIFKKGYSVDLVVFMMKYLVSHGCKINSPYGLYYVIKNKLVEAEFADDRKRKKVLDRFEYRQRKSAESQGKTWG